MGFIDEEPEEVVIATVQPQYSRDATHILERWEDYRYVEVGRAHSEEEALRKAQKIANNKEVDIRVRLTNSWDN
jgi:hypothetical protein